MKSFKEMIGETVNPPKGEDEKNFVDKHIVDKKDHPVAKDDQFVSKAKKAKRKADHEDDAAVYEEARQIECEDCGCMYPKEEECPDCAKEHKEGYMTSSYKKKKKPMSEEEMSDAQAKKKEEIVKSMKKNIKGFKDRYGDKADEVMHATATKMAMKEETEEEISEAVIDDLRKIVKTKGAKDVKFKDGQKLKVDMTTASAMVQVHDKLNSGNAKKFADAINKNENMFMKMLDFAFSGGKKR